MEHEQINLIIVKRAEIMIGAHIHTDHYNVDRSIGAFTYVQCPLISIENICRCLCTHIE